MIKSFLLLLCIVSLGACTKSESTANYDLIVGKWTTKAYFVNGVATSGAPPAFEFTRGGIVYFTPPPSIFVAGYKYEFITNTFVRIYAATTYDLAIDALNDKMFYFTLTNNKDRNVEIYQTVKQ